MYIVDCIFPKKMKHKTYFAQHALFNDDNGDNVYVVYYTEQELPMKSGVSKKSFFVSHFGNGRYENNMIIFEDLNQTTGLSLCCTDFTEFKDENGNINAKVNGGFIIISDEDPEYRRNVIFK